MLFDNEISYILVVCGIVEINVMVEVSQNGFVIYFINVLFGVFEIIDIYFSGFNGDLEVKIIEVDGCQWFFKQFYFYLLVMICKGNLCYGLVVGEYYNDGQLLVNLFQGLVVYGLFDRVIGFGGLFVVEKYNVINLGFGFNMLLGGFFVDVIYSQFCMWWGGCNQGQSLWFFYFKIINVIEISFIVVGYCYFMEGYCIFSQYIDDMFEESYFYGLSFSWQKSCIDLMVNQMLF